MPELTFEDLRCQYQNGRALLLSGEGRNRVYGYRTGVQCELGDIERSEWIQMVKDAIDRAGEQALYEQLLQHLKDHNYTRASRAELEFKALELHAFRIFDDELWVDYLQFSLKFRPDVIDPTRLVSVMPVCCKKAGSLPGRDTRRTGSITSALTAAAGPRSGFWRRGNMLGNDHARQAYERFRLQWMIDHGYSLEDLVRNLESMILEDENESGVRTDLASLFQDWEFGIGFDGSIWPFYQEFLENEYLDMLEKDRNEE